MELTLNQLKHLIDMCDGEEDKITIEEQDEGHSGKGLYAWYSEYPEEGSIYLGV